MMVTWPEIVAGGGERTDVNAIGGKKLKELVMAWPLDLRERRRSGDSQMSSTSNLDT